VVIFIFINIICRNCIMLHSFFLFFFVVEKKNLIIVVY
jgi:hypothetical protein